MRGRSLPTIHPLTPTPLPRVRGRGLSGSQRIYQWGAAVPAPDPTRGDAMDPQQLRFSKTHEWARLEGDVTGHALEFERLDEQLRRLHLVEDAAETPFVAFGIDVDVVPAAAPARLEGLETHL